MNTSLTHSPFIWLFNLDSLYFSSPISSLLPFSFTLSEPSFWPLLLAQDSGCWFNWIVLNSGSLLHLLWSSRGLFDSDFLWSTALEHCMNFAICQRKKKTPSQLQVFPGILRRWVYQLSVKFGVKQTRSFRRSTGSLEHKIRAADECVYHMTRLYLGFRVDGANQGLAIQRQTCRLFGSSTHTGLTSLGLPQCLPPYPLASPRPSPPLCSPFPNLPVLDWGRWLRHQRLCLTVDQNSGLMGERLIPHRLPLHPHSRRFAIPSSSPAPLH